MNKINLQTFLSCIVVAVLASLAVQPALADYNFEGVPYTDELAGVTQGTVRGGVYVDGGHGIGSSPYTQSFTVPGGTVKWARLYVGVWGGSEEKSGSIAVAFNGENLGTLELEGKNDTNPNVYCSGHGVYWIFYDVTDITTSGPIDSVVTTGGDFDGRVYGIVLVAVYDDPDAEEVEYRISDGNPNLHGLGLVADEPVENNESYAYFSGIDPDRASAARLTVAYLCGSPYENDYLYFNDDKLNGDDVASSTGYFDLLTFDVTDILEESSEAKFDRGDEFYVHPVLAVLTLDIEAVDWNIDGVPLQTIKQGNVNGGIYVGGGHGKEYTTSYTQNFTVPNGTVKWARLYVSAKDTPWINASLNGHFLGNYTKLTDNPKVYANYKPDQSMYWTYYDNVEDFIVNGNNTATADLGTNAGNNTKSWGISLLVVYEGGDNPENIEYWVNEGNPLLHGDHSPFDAYQNTTSTSFAAITNLDSVNNATLWTAYIWGSEESEGVPNDSLWFNSNLIAEDSSDGAGTDDQGNIWRGGCFDLEKWDVTSSLATDNVVLLDRGGDDLLCPVGAILVLKHISEPTAENGIVQLHATILPTVSLEVTPDSLYFGTLAPGRKSDEQELILSSKSSHSIVVTADVTDTAGDLFVDGLLLDSESWSAYSQELAKGTSVNANVVLGVPVDYTGVGIQEGSLIFWTGAE
ncbi:MAG: DUF3344 domain-containing protein [Methanosarcinaceae archaeon]|nr:DUF3344 domain-containing protein [Methanosarcinaceae archaeon]